MGDTGDSNEPLPLEKDKKKKKLDEIVFGLSAAKGSNMFSPPMPSERGSSSKDHARHSNSSAGNMHPQAAHGSSSRNTVSPQVSSGVRSGTPSPQVHHSASSAAAASAQASKDAQAFAQSFLSNMSNMTNNPLLSALSMFNSKELKDFSKYAAANAAAANLSASAASKKESAPRGGTTGMNCFFLNSV